MESKRTKIIGELIKFGLNPIQVEFMDNMQFYEAAVEFCKSKIEQREELIDKAYENWEENYELDIAVEVSEILNEVTCLQEVLSDLYLSFGSSLFRKSLVVLLKKQDFNYLIDSNTKTMIEKEIKAKEFKINKNFKYKIFIENKENKARFVKAKKYSITKIVDDGYNFIIYINCDLIEDINMNMVSNTLYDMVVNNPQDIWRLDYHRSPKSKVFLHKSNKLQLCHNFFTTDVETTKHLSELVKNYNVILSKILRLLYDKSVILEASNEDLKFVLVKTSNPIVQAQMIAEKVLTNDNDKLQDFIKELNKIKEEV